MATWQRAISFFLRMVLLLLSSNNELQLTLAGANQMFLYLTASHARLMIQSHNTQSMSDDNWWNGHQFCQTCLYIYSIVLPTAAQVYQMLKYLMILGPFSASIIMHKGFTLTNETDAPFLLKKQFFYPFAHILLLWLYLSL